MAVLTLQPANGADTYITELASSTNEGNETNLVVGNIFAATNDHGHRALLRFDLTSIPTHAEIVSAVLTLTSVNGTGISSGTFTFTVHRTTTAWTESGATWLSPDGIGLWTTTGGDYVASAADTYVLSAGAAPLVFSSMATLVDDAIQSRSGFLNIIVKGPEVTGISQFINLASSDHATIAKPKLVVTYTIYPVVERIARVMKDRLDHVTIANGYELDLITVRPTRTGEELSPQDCLTILAQSTQSERDEQNDIEGNPPGMAWIQDFTITGIASPSEADGIPIDTAANVLAAEIARGITLDNSADWAQFDGLALQARQTAGNIDCDGQLGFANLTYSVTYRTYENDPYTVR